MAVTGSNSVASQVYSGVQGRNGGPQQGQAPVRERPSSVASGGDTGFRLPSSATPRGDWVLSENANPQAFDSNSPRGSYLNVVV